MNRRSFVSLGVAVVAPFSVAVPVSAQRAPILESMLTGATLDFSDTNYEFVDHTATTSTDGGTTERFELTSELSTLIVQLISWVPQPKVTDLHLQAVDSMATTYGEDNVEHNGLHELEDGAWMSFRIAAPRKPVEVWYSEFQNEAFPDVNLFIEINMLESDAEAALAEAQRVLIAGMPPFLFFEESGADSDLFVTATADTGRSSRGTRSSSETTSTSTVAMTEEEVVQAVRDHQAQFHDELATFDAQVQAGLEDDADSAEWFTVMLDLMFSWSTYPTPASELIFPDSLSTLASDYTEWADGIGDMGAKMGQWMTGSGEIDAFIDAMDIVIELDRALSANLRTLGVAPSNRTISTARLRISQLTELDACQQRRASEGTNIS